MASKINLQCQCIDLKFSVVYYAGRKNCDVGKVVI